MSRSKNMPVTTRERNRNQSPLKFSSGSETKGEKLDSTERIHRKNVPQKHPVRKETVKAEKNTRATKSESKSDVLKNAKNLKRDIRKIDGKKNIDGPKLQNNAKKSFVSQSRERLQVDRENASVKKVTEVKEIADLVQKVSRDDLKLSSPTTVSGVVDNSAVEIPELSEEEEYEDDFEDYESDFEESSGSEVDEVDEKRDGEAFEVAASSKEIQHSVDLLIGDENKQQIHQTFRSFIDFATTIKDEAETRTKSKVATRWSELQELITLDKQRFVLFELPPAKYESYIQTFGKSNHKQAYSQTDIPDEESVQTDTVELREKWTQFPAHDLVGVGGDIDDEANLLSHHNPIRMEAFLHNVSRVIVDLLDEEYDNTECQKLQPDTNFAISHGYTRVNFPIRDTVITKLEVLPSAKHLLSIHDLSSRVTNKGIICVWNTSTFKSPERLLLCNSIPSCCCFGLDNAQIIFAGAMDGSVSLWDLCDSHAIRQKLPLAEPVEATVATYVTAVVLRESGHCSSVVSVTSISMDRGACRLLSLEENGIFVVWVAVRSMYSDQCGSETDLGLAPGGKWKLVKSSSVHLDKLFAVDRATFSCFDLQMEGNDVFIATNIGKVLHCSHGGSKGNPISSYELRSNRSTEVNCLSFSPHGMPYFLAGCGDGSVRLHNVLMREPLLTCISLYSERIVELCWVCGRPSAFLVLDVSTHLSLWDVAKDSLRPILVMDQMPARIVDFCVFGGSGIGSQQKDHLVLAYENGDLELHLLKNDIFSGLSYEEMLDFMLNKL